MKDWSWQDWLQWVGSSIVLPLTIVGVGMYTTLQLLDQRMKQAEDWYGKHEDLHTENAVDASQWNMLRNHTESIAAYEQKFEHLDKLTAPSEIQEWGNIKKQVPKNTELLLELRDRVTRLEAQQ